MAIIKDYQLIWESYEDNSVARMQDDEHAPPEPVESTPDRSRQTREAMNDHDQLVRVATQYEGLSDRQLNQHIHVLESLVELGEDDRNRYFGGDLGSPF